MQKRSSNTVEVKFFKLDYKEVLKRLKEYAEKALAKGAKTVILIGSLARGDYTAFSDADILIISDNAPSNPLERLRDFIDPTLPVDVEPRVYTTRELIEMAREGRRIIKEILEYGIILAGDKKVIDEIKKNIKKTENT